MRSTNVFFARHTIVASSGTYTGRGASSSPKQAMEKATANAWSDLDAGDAKKGICSGIAVDQYGMRRGHKVILNRTDM